MSNDDKLKVRQTESKKNAFKELTIIRDTIFWIDVVGEGQNENAIFARPFNVCLLYTSPSPRDNKASRMPSSA